jgi:hypothetical protein
MSNGSLPTISLLKWPVTIGPPALWNVFPTFFSLTLRMQSGFEVKDVVAVLTRIATFDFSAWKQYGTGNQAEIFAGNDLKATLLLAHNSVDGSGKSLRV